MKIELRTAVLALLLAASPALAEAGGETIVVTASRTPTPLDAVGQSISLVTQEDIGRLQSVSVVDALRLVPGVTFARNGPVGSVTSVFVRGADSDQTVTLIDGVKINDPSSPGGGFDFGALLLGTIDRIEVLKGSHSVIWGSQAIGGVVHLLTAAPGEQWRLDSQAQGGFRNSWQLVGNASGLVGPVGASLGASWFRTDGFSAFSEARGGRERDGHENLALTGRLAVDLAAPLSLDLRGFYVDSETGIDGFPPPTFAFADTPEISRSKQFVGYAGVRLRLFEGRLGNRFAYTHTIVDRQNSNPAATPRVGFDGLGRNERFEYQGVAEGGWIAAVFGYEHEKSRFRTQNFGGPVARARAMLDSAYAQLTVRPFDGLALTGGVRHDAQNVFGGRTTLAASGAFTPNGGQTVVRASFGQGFKVPSLFQLFSDFGNDRLVPEESDSFDIGITQRLADGTAEASATWFRRLTRNQIDFVSCFGNPSVICTDRPFGTYDNVRRTRAEGVELGLLLRPARWLEARAGYTFLDAKNRDTGLELARRPREVISGQVDASLPFGLRLGATLFVSGRSFDNPANTTRLAGYTLVDLRAAMPVGERIELFGRIENLFDETYETVFRYGTQPRAAFAGARLRL
ncbi:MAG: TonB-dependent receptor plug domain-containing protein [Thermaurantiacus sp.]